MTKAEHQLKISIETFIISLQNYGLKDSSMVQYRSICNGIRLFAERNPNYDFPEMLNKFLSLSEENSSYCKGYQRAKRRVVRILCEIHDGKEPNLGHPKLGIINYKVPDSTLSVINDILSINKINEKERVHFSAHMLNAFMADVNSLQAAVQNREQLQTVIHELRSKYSASELDFDVISVLEDVISKAEKEIAAKEENWRKEHLTLGDRTRTSIHSWKDNTRVLPAFLSPDTLEMVEELSIEADQIISEAKIEDVVFYFNKLTDEEKKHCLEILLHQ